MHLLIVEDDADGREMLVELFRLHAWDVIAASSTAEAMAELRAGSFDVIISDEDLCGHSGSRMLCEAAEQGLLGGAGIIMYTADPERLETPPGTRFLCKPLGITGLLDAATEAAARAGRARPPTSGERLRDDACSANANANANAPPPSRAR